MLSGNRPAGQFRGHPDSSAPGVSPASALASLSAHQATTRTTVCPASNAAPLSSSQLRSSQLASQPSGLQRWSQWCPQNQCFSGHLFKCQGLHQNQPDLHGSSCQSLNQPSSRQRCTKSCCPTRFTQLTRRQWCCQTSDCQCSSLPHDCHRGPSCPSSWQSSTPHPSRCHHKWSRCPLPSWRASPARTWAHCQTQHQPWVRCPVPDPPADLVPVLVQQSTPVDKPSPLADPAPTLCLKPVPVLGSSADPASVLGPSPSPAPENISLLGPQPALGLVSSPIPATLPDPAPALDPQARPDLGLPPVTDLDEHPAPVGEPPSDQLSFPVPSKDAWPASVGWPPPPAWTPPAARAWTALTPAGQPSPPSQIL